MMERIRLPLWLAATLFVAVVASGATDSPRRLVINVSNQVIEALHKEPDLAKRDSNYVYSLLNRTVVPHFDFKTMARLVLGHFWRDANNQQQQRFIDAFRTYLVRVYAVSLAKYEDQKIDYKPLHAPATADKVLVQTEVQQGGGPPIAIDYRMHRKGDEWKVYDVVIEGVSLVASNRSSFAAEIHQGGIDKLTARLAQNNGKRTTQN
jgi:phospholipid transport system substrate-binding protein